MRSLQPIESQQIAVRASSTNLREVIYIVFRRRWVIMAIAIPIIIVASLGLFKKTGSYIAACQLLIELRDPEEPRWSPATAHIDEDRILSTYMHMAVSVPVATKAAESLRDSIPAIIRRVPELESLTGKRRLIRYMSEHLDAHQLGESDILALTFQSPDPGLSLMALNACRDAFLDFSIYGVKKNRAIEYYDEQIESVRGVIDSLLAARTEILRSAGFSSIEDDLSHGTVRLGDLQDEYYNALTQRTNLESKLALFKKSFAADPTFFPIDDHPLTMEPLLDAKRLLEKYRSQLNELLVNHPESSTLVQRQKGLVEQAQQQYQGTVQDYLNGLSLAVESARDLEQTRKLQMEEFGNRLASAPELYHKVGLLDVELKGQQSLLEDIQIKSGEVRLDLMADERISRIIRLTEPQIRKVVSTGRMFTYFALVSLFGMIFSIIVAITVDRQDHKIYTARSIEEFIEVPVLGVITDARQARRS